MDWLEEAIKKTREYGGRFGVEYGLTQIKERLISDKIFVDKDIDKKLKGLKLQTSNFKLQKEKVEKAKKLAKFIGRYFKDILMIGITGSVAAGYPKKKADIDLMIVTKRDRLWLTRLLLRVFVYINGIPHRRYGENEKGNEFCFNLWLEEDVLKLPREKQNLQNAMDSILMIPILDRDNMYKKFLKENKWIRNFVANTYEKIS